MCRPASLTLAGAGGVSAASVAAASMLAAGMQPGIGGLPNSVATACVERTGSNGQRIQPAHLVIK